jgi:hypothetical protein
MADKDKVEDAHNEYEAMLAARKLTAESTSWLDQILSNINTSEKPQPETK